MAKRLGTTYRPGTRTKEWRKVKNRRRAEVVIGGYSPGTGNRGIDVRGPARRALGRRRGSPSPAASAPASRSARLEELAQRLQELRVDDCPFDPPPPTAYRAGAVWVAARC